MQETADEFVARVNSENDDFDKEGNAADWTQKTYITADTEMLNARATDRAARLHRQVRRRVEAL